MGERGRAAGVKGDVDVSGEDRQTERQFPPVVELKTSQTFLNSQLVNSDKDPPPLLIGYEPWIRVRCHSKGLNRTRKRLASIILTPMFISLLITNSVMSKNALDLF